MKQAGSRRAAGGQQGTGDGRHTPGFIQYVLPNLRHEGLYWWEGGRGGQKAVFMYPGNRPVDARAGMVCVPSCPVLDLYLDANFGWYFTVSHLNP